MNEYIPVGSLAVLVIGVLIKVNSDMKDKPTFSHLESDYQRKDVCNEIHKRVDEKLERIEKGVDKLLYKNGL